jgi:hypothetical protein
MILDLEETFVVGGDTFFDSMSPTSTFGVIFEDDLTTGYFYAINKEPTISILDALHIYNVSDVVDKDKPCKIQIAWNENGDLASLLINNYCHAIFDFKNKAGYCRNAFPPSNGEWRSTNNERKLTEDMIARLFENQ